MNYRILLALLGLALSSGCGDDGTAGASGGTGGQGGSPATGGGPGTGGIGGVGGTGGTGGQGGGVPDCATLFAAVDQAVLAAKACDPTIDFNECTEILKGPCCPLAINPMNTAALAELIDLLGQLESSQCGFPCNPKPCVDEPIGFCTGEGTQGQCSEAEGP